MYYIKGRVKYAFMLNSELLLILKTVVVNGCNVIICNVNYFVSFSIDKQYIV